MGCVGLLCVVVVRWFVAGCVVLCCVALFGVMLRWFGLFRDVSFCFRLCCVVLRCGGVRGVVPCCLFRVVCCVGVVC